MYVSGNNYKWPGGGRGDRIYIKGDIASQFSIRVLHVLGK
jgi:hypothetical protein